MTSKLCTYTILVLLLIGGGFASPEKPRIILTIDGGGINGMAPLIVLEKLKELTGLDPHEIFDVILGTSSGAVTGACLLLKNSAATCKRYFKEAGNEIFGANFFEMARQITESWRDPVNAHMYDGVKYREWLKKMIKESPVGKSKEGEILLNDTAISHIKFCSVATTAREIAPISQLLCNFKIVFNGLYGDIPLSEAIYASSAAPFYFPPTKIKDLLLQDGGIGYNNPVNRLPLILNLNKKDIVVSLGTGLALDSDRAHQEFYQTIKFQMNPSNYYRIDPTGMGESLLNAQDIQQLVTRYLDKIETQNILNQLSQAIKTQPKKTLEIPIQPENPILSINNLEDTRHNIVNTTKVFPCYSPFFINSHHTVVKEPLNILYADKNKKIVLNIASLNMLRQTLSGKVYIIGHIGKFQVGKSTLSNWLSQYVGAEKIMSTGMGHEATTLGVWFVVLHLTSGDTLILVDCEGIGSGDDEIIRKYQTFVALLSDILVGHVEAIIDNSFLHQITAIKTLAEHYNTKKGQVIINIKNFKGKLTVNKTPVTNEEYLQSIFDRFQIPINDLTSISLHTVISPNTKASNILTSPYGTWQKLYGADKKFHKEYSELVCNILNKTSYQLHPDLDMTNFLELLDTTYQIILSNDFGLFETFWTNYYSTKVNEAINEAVKVGKDYFEKNYPEPTGDDSQAQTVFNVASRLASEKIDSSVKHLTNIHVPNEFLVGISDKVTEKLNTLLSDMENLNSELIREKYESIMKFLLAFVFFLLGYKI